MKLFYDLTYRSFYKWSIWLKSNWPVHRSLMLNLSKASLTIYDTYEKVDL